MISGNLHSRKDSPYVPLGKGGVKSARVVHFSRSAAARERKRQKQTPSLFNFVITLDGNTAAKSKRLTYLIIPLTYSSYKATAPCLAVMMMMMWGLNVLGCRVDMLGTKLTGQQREQ